MKNALISAIEKAVNRLLALDPDSEKRLIKLQDKTAVIELLGLSLVFNLFFDRGKIRFAAEVHQPDVTIRGTPLSLAQVTLNKTKRQKFFAEDVVIEGDAELGQQIILLFDELDIDWEENLSQWIGDVPAHQIGKIARKTQSVAKQLFESVTQNVNEYVHEEINFFPTREQLNDFFNDIDETRMHADRLEARILKLKRKSETT